MMLKNYWYVVFESKRLRKNQPVGITRLGEKLVLWRDATGQVACIADQCAHRGASLSQGRVCSSNIQCPFHGFQYDVSGQCKLIPANGAKTPVPDSIRVRSYPAVDRHGFIWIFWGDPVQAPPPIPFFEDLDNTFSSAGSVTAAPIHYTRAVENQLDPIHLPFVHRTTIGAGNKTIIHGPRVEVQEQAGVPVMKFWVKNEPDHGQTPLKPAEMPPSDPNAQHLELRFPNLWQNWLTAKMRIIIAFTPVNQDHTLIYMRVCQKFLKIPGLRWLFNQLMLYFSQIVLGQDNRVVIPELPKETRLKMNEKLIPGDLPIIKYRELREEALQKQAGTGTNQPNSPLT